MSTEQGPRHLLFPKVTDQAIRSEVAGHSAINIGLGSEFAALYAVGVNKPIWAAAFAVGGALHFLIAKLNFSEMRKIRDESEDQGSSYDTPKASGVWVTSEALPLDEGNRPPAPSTVPSHIASRGAALAGRLVPPPYRQGNDKKDRS